MIDMFGNVVPGTEAAQPGSSVAPLTTQPAAAPQPAPPQPSGILDRAWGSVVGGLKSLDETLGFDTTPPPGGWQNPVANDPMNAGSIRAIRNVTDPLNEKVARGAEALRLVNPGTADATVQQNQKDLADYNAKFGSSLVAGANKTAGEFGVTGALMGGLGGLASKAFSSVAPSVSDAVDLLLGNKAPVASAVIAPKTAANVVLPAATGAAQGGTAAALTTGGSDQPAGQQIASGANTGMWLGPAFQLVAQGLNSVRGITGEIPGYLRTLAQKAEDYGIPVSWQNINTAPGFRFIKDIGSNLPLGGGKPEETPGVEAIHEQLNGLMDERGPYVTPQTLGSGMQKAQDTMNTVAGRTTLTMDPTLDTALTDIANRAPRSPDGGAPATNAITELRKQFADPNTGAGPGTVSGGDYRAWTQRNGGLFDDFRGDGSSPSDHLVNKVEDALDGAFHRSAAPGDQDALSDALTKYRIGKTLEPAVINSDQTGVLNPSTLNNSVKQQSKRWDTSTGGIGYGDPNNPDLEKLNDLSDIYKNFFGRTSISQAGPGISGQEAIGLPLASAGLETAGHFLGAVPGLATGAAGVGLGLNAAVQRLMNRPQIATNIVQTALNPQVRQAAELRARMLATQLTRAGTLSGVPQTVPGTAAGLLGY